MSRWLIAAAYRVFPDVRFARARATARPTTTGQHRASTVLNRRQAVAVEATDYATAPGPTACAHHWSRRATIGDHHRQIHRNLSRSVSTTAPTDPGQGHRQRVELTGELVAPNSPEG